MSDIIDVEVIDSTGEFSTVEMDKEDVIDFLISEGEACSKCRIVTNEIINFNEFSYCKACYKDVENVCFSCGTNLFALHMVGDNGFCSECFGKLKNK